MALAETIGFLLVSFMFMAIVIKFAVLIWNAIVIRNDRYYYEREFWDEDGEVEAITADTMVAMKTRITPIEIIEDREEAYEQS